MAASAQNKTAFALPVLSLAFRPFFLAAAAWAALALAIWIAAFLGDVSIPSRFDPLSWHVHAMLFGFVLAAIAGFLLTAIPNWTGRAPIHGLPLAALFFLWLAGRVVCFTSAFLPFAVAAVIDLAFPFTLAAVAAREIITARNWRNLAMPLPVLLLGVADLLMHLQSGGIAVPSGLGWRLGLAAIIVLISVVGGRIIPAFTRNWLMKRGAAHLPAPRNLIDRAGLGLLHAGLIGWAFFPAIAPFGALLLLGAAATLWRLARWRGLVTLDEPLLTILHLGYLWVAVGAALLGAAMLTPDVPQMAAIHALTAGAIGTMTLAVMTRVSRGHTGRGLTADGPARAIYAAITLAAILRVAAAFADTPSMLLLKTSALLWILSFGLFVLFYWRMNVSARVA